MRRIINFISICSLVLFLSLPVFADGQWYKIQEQKNYNLNHCFFLNTREVWAVGDSGQVLKSTDGGFTWASQQITSNKLCSVFFSDSNHGWIGTTNGNVFHTTNGSADLNSVNWSSSYTGVNTLINDIYFVDNNIGFAAPGSQPGLPPTVLKSINGGITWETYTIQIKIGSSLDGIVFSKDNSQFGVLIGNTAAGIGYITQTQNLGTTWGLGVSPFDLFGISQRINKVSIPSASSAWIAGDAGYIYYSFDNGNSWGFSPTTHGQNNSDIFFVNESNGWVVGTKDAYVTTNRGTSWTTINLPDRKSDFLTGVSAADTDHVCIVGDNGVIYISSPIVPPSQAFPSSVEVSVVAQQGAADLSWTAATDVYGISGYQIYRAKKSEGTVVVSDNFDSSILNTSIWSKFYLLNPGANYTLSQANGKIIISGTATSKDNALGLISLASANPQKLVSISTDVDLNNNLTSIIAGPAISDITIGQSFFDPFLGESPLMGGSFAIGFASSALKEPMALAPASPSGEVKALIYNNYGSIFFNNIYKGKGPASLSGNLYYGLFAFLGSSDATTTVTFDNFNATEYPITLISSVGASATSYHDASVSPRESYFYTVVPVNNLGHTSGSNVVEAAIAATPSGTPSSVTGVASIQGNEITLTIHSNTPINISSSAASNTPISFTVYSPNWSDRLDASSAASIKQSSTGDVTIKWQTTGKIANLDKGIYPAILKVGGITQKIYLVKY